MFAVAPSPKIRLTIAMCQFNLGLAALFTTKEVVAILLTVFFSRKNILWADFLHGVAILEECETNNHYVFLSTLNRLQRFLRIQKHKLSSLTPFTNYSFFVDNRALMWYPMHVPQSSHYVNAPRQKGLLCFCQSPLYHISLKYATSVLFAFAISFVFTMCHPNPKFELLNCPTTHLSGRTTIFQPLTKKGSFDCQTDKTASARNFSRNNLSGILESINGERQANG